MKNYSIIIRYKYAHIHAARKISNHTPNHSICNNHTPTHIHNISVHTLSTHSQYINNNQHIFYHTHPRKTHTYTSHYTLYTYRIKLIRALILWSSAENDGYNCNAQQLPLNYQTVYVYYIYKHLHKTHKAIPHVHTCYIENHYHHPKKPTHPKTYNIIWK